MWKKLTALVLSLLLCVSVLTALPQTACQAAEPDPTVWIDPEGPKDPQDPQDPEDPEDPDDPGIAPNSEFPPWPSDLTTE